MPRGMTKYPARSARAGYLLFVKGILLTEVEIRRLPFIIPLLRIISTYGSYNDLTNLDVIWIITNFIRYTNFKWEWLNLSDSEINNLVNKRTVTKQ